MLGKNYKYLKKSNAKNDLWYGSQVLALTTKDYKNIAHAMFSIIKSSKISSIK